MPLDESPCRAAGCVAGQGAAGARGPETPAPAKFSDPAITAKGEPRAKVPFVGYQTLWFNTGTLCNIACQNCYIESSPRNDRLEYLTRAEVRRFLDEATGLDARPHEIGFTGGEPFMNPDVLGMVEDSLSAGLRVLILTNAMRPMQRKKEELLSLRRRFPGRIQVRVSIDHHQREGHEKIRGPRSWQPVVEGLQWLSANGFALSVAARLLWEESEDSIRNGYRKLFEATGISVDAHDPACLVLFPEMSDADDVPEISEGCWGILGKSPAGVMCATARMVVKRKRADAPVVVACTLLPYSEAFEMGPSLREARRPVSLNHRHCARFCVLGGATCSARA